MDSKLSFNVESNTLTVREGLAKEFVKRTEVSIEGDIVAPLDFYKKRKLQFVTSILEEDTQGMYDSKDTHVFIDRKDKKFSLKINQGRENSLRTTVTGVLTYNKLLDSLKINNDSHKGFLPSELAKILRMNGTYFAEPSTHKDLILKLQDFKAKVEVQVQDKDDKKGNITKSVIKNLVEKDNYDFALFVPIFDGLEAETVKIEVDFEYGQDAEIRCYLISPELKDVEQNTLNSQINIYQEVFKAFPVIVK